MLRGFKDIKKSSVLAIWVQIYVKNKCKLTDSIVELVVNRFIKILGYIMNILDSAFWLWSLAYS